MKKKHSLWFLVLAVLVLLMPLSANSASKVAKTGQTTSYYEGDDGDLEVGVDWPVPRFVRSDCDGTDNAAGDCMRDDLTGLIWLRDANCLASEYPGSDSQGVAGDGAVFWEQAMEWVYDLNAGSYPNCAGGQSDWRMPNLNEIESLVNYGEADNAAWLNSQGFINVPTADRTAYWVSSTAYGNQPNASWFFSVRIGEASHDQAGGHGMCGGDRESLNAGCVTDGIASPLIWPVRGSAQDDLGAVNLLQTMDTQCYRNTSGITWAEVSCADGTWPAMTLEDGHPSQRRGVPWTGGPTRWIDVGNGTLIDLMTGLQWTKAGNIQYAHGTPALDAWVLTFTEALDYVAAMNAGTYENWGYTDWRLPNQREMISLMTLTKNYPYQDLEAWGFEDFFPLNSWNLHWTSTSDPADPGTYGNNDGNSYGFEFGEAGHLMWKNPKTTVPWWNGERPGNWEWLNYYIMAVRTAPEGSQLNVTVVPAGLGTVTKTPDEEAYAIPPTISEDVTLTPVPNDGYALGSWTGCDDDTSSPPDCIATMEVTDLLEKVYAFFIPPTVDTAVRFGKTGVGTTPVRTLTITNDGLGDMFIDDINNVQTLAPPFSVWDVDCGFPNVTLSAGSSCNVAVGFSPTGSGAFSDTFNISSSSTIVTVTGRGVGSAGGPDIYASETTLSFLNTELGATTVDQTVRVTNVGGSTLNIGTITAPGGNFNFDASACDSTALGAGASCDITISYTAPGAPEGPVMASFSIPSNDPNENPVTVSILASAIDSAGALGDANHPPVRPVLQSPANGATGVQSINLTWTPSESDDDPFLVDPDGDTVNHTVYYSTDPSFEGATVIASSDNDSGISYAAAIAGNPVFMAALFGLVAFGVFLRRKKIALIIVALVFVSGLLLTACGGSSDEGGESATGNSLQAGQTYYWMVVADDGRGGVSASEIWSFTTSSR